MVGMAFNQDPYRPGQADNVNAVASDDAQTAADNIEAEADAPTGTTREILEWVGGDVDRATAARRAELSGGSPRKGLLAELDAITNDTV